ncbi:hypothetical protein F2Q69_00047076 [Brassica cretica]|uniref:Uncharacterized protein n=1 Tax=Brassica cretica TaxID=69181 RepID=A0A8S9Q4S3_BRACR|nr:hypothetical protein F2Q69_00047076 [Brassica cretica]
MPFLACARLPDQVGFAPSCLLKSRGDLLFCGFIPRLSRVDEDLAAFGSSRLNLQSFATPKDIFLPNLPDSSVSFGSCPRDDALSDSITTIESMDPISTLMPFLACARLPDQVGFAPSCLFKSRGDLLFCGFIPRLSRVDEDLAAFGSSRLNL